MKTTADLMTDAECRRFTEMMIKNAHDALRALKKGEGSTGVVKKWVKANVEAIKAADEWVEGRQRW